MNDIEKHGEGEGELGMSLKKAEQHLKELEAIKYYDTVKLERDNLSKEVEGLKAELSNREPKVKELSQINEDSEKKIAERDKRIESLGNELKIKDANIKQSEEGVKQNEVRISELEGLKAIAEGKALKEAKEAFLKAREEEIMMEAENLFSGMKTEWEKNVKPKEVLFSVEGSYEDDSTIQGRVCLQRRSYIKKGASARENRRI